MVHLHCSILPLSDIMMRTNNWIASCPLEKAGESPNPNSLLHALASKTVPAAPTTWCRGCGRVRRGRPRRKRKVWRVAWGPSWATCSTKWSPWRSVGEVLRMGTLQIVGEIVRMGSSGAAVRGERGWDERGQRHWKRLLKRRGRTSRWVSHTRGTSREKLTRKPGARETKLWLSKETIAGFLKSWRSQAKATHSFASDKKPSSTSSKLLHPPLFASLVLEPNLYHSHWEARVLCQCLSDVSRWLWSLVKGQLENLELFGLDRCTWTSSLRPPRPVFALVALGRVVLRVTIH